MSLQRLAPAARRSAPGASGTLPSGRTTWHGAATITMAGREAILLSAVALYMDHPE